MEFKLSKVWRSNYLTIFSFSCFSFSLDTTSSKSNLAGSYKGRVRVIHKHKYKHSSKRCVSTRSYFYCSNFWLPASWDVCRKFRFSLILQHISNADEHDTKQVTVSNFEQTNTLLPRRQHCLSYEPLSGSNGFTLSRMHTCSPDQCWFRAFRRTKSPIRL